MTFNCLLAAILITSYGIVNAKWVINCSGKDKNIDSVNVSSVITSILSNYDKRVRPNFDGAPVEVELSMYILSFSSISDVNMDYTVHFYFRQHWNDPRLSFAAAGLDNLNLAHDFGKMIWVPDTFFVNEKESSMHFVTTKNEFIRVDSSGKVTKSERLSLKASCPMDLRSFPMDKQACSLEIESYGHNEKGIKFSWKKSGNAIGVAADAAIGSLFDFVDFTESSQLVQLSTGNYSRLQVQFEFVRTKGHYFMQIYIPCTMLIILSWISFWINHKASNVRLAICSLSLLLMVMGCQTFSGQIPQTSYMKAVDVFTGICSTFIFVALIECAYILNNNINNGKDNKVNDQSRIDKYFIIGYPIAFLIFNILYWAVCLSG